MSEWANIPGHLLEIIAEKGTGFEDIVAIGLTCKSWKDVAVVCKETFMKKQTPQLPWLMLPPRKGNHLRDFYSLATRRIHEIPSWEFNGKKCYSSRGWLLTVGPDWGINLLHPLTLARFKLPGIKSFGEPTDVALSKPCVRFIHRAVLSASPSLTSNFVLVVIQGIATVPAYWRPGDKRWTLIETSENNYADAVFYQDKCYFITFFGKLLVADFGTSNPTAKFITKFSKNLIQGSFWETLYLVILEGSLLLVSREVSECFPPQKEFHERPYKAINYFQVFKLDFKSLSWNEIKNLESWSLFLGHNSSTALNASVVKGCKPNSIYFIDDSFVFRRNNCAGTGFDMGIFNMDDQTIEPIIEGEWHNRVSPPIFVDPTF